MPTRTLRRMFILFMTVALSAGAAESCLAQSATEIAPELGITPESLVMVGFEPSDASTMLQRIDGASSETQALDAAHSALDTALGQLEAALAALRENPTDPDLLQLVEAAQQGVSTARSGLVQAQNALALVVLDGFASPLIDDLEDCRTGEPYRVPHAFRADARDDAEWRLIEAALRMESRCDRTGEALPTEYEQLLTTVRLDSDVVLAQTRLDTGLQAMEQVFNSY